MIELEEFRSTIWMLLLQIKDNMEKILQPFGQQHGMTVLQLRILIELKDQESFTISELAKRMSMAVGNVSSLCKKVEREGLLIRARDALDERIVHITLSQQGKKLIDELDSWMREKCQATILALPRNDFNHIVIGLKTLAQLFENVVENMNQKS